MTKFARILPNGIVAEVCSAAALATHEPILAATFIACPDNVTQNSSRNADNSWTIFVPPPVVTVLPLLTPMTLYLSFTPAERIAIKKSADPMVVEFWATYQLSVQLGTMIDPNLMSVQDGIGYLARPTSAAPPGPGILASSARVTQILSGAPQ